MLVGNARTLTVQSELHVNVPFIICHLLKSYGITRKKIQQVALQQCNALRRVFISLYLLFHPDMFVFVDKTGTDHTNHIRKYGYSIRGVTLVTHRLLHRGKWINAIFGISTDGVIALETITTTVNGDTVFDFVRGSLIPNLTRFLCSSRSICTME